MTRPDNVGPDASGFESRWLTYDLLERLPAPLRSLIAAAPYDYALLPLWRSYEQNLGIATLEQIEFAWARKMTRDRRAAALELYGPDHPQAR